MSIVNLKMLLQNKLRITVIVLALFWVVSDATNRLTLKFKKNNNTAITVDISELILPRLTSEMIKKLDAAYKKYETTETLLIDNQVGMSAQLQSEQQGELDTVFAGDNKLKLKAVVQYKNSAIKRRYALIEVVNLKDNQLKTIKYEQNANVFGYQLVIIDNRKVTLSRLLEDGQQQITLIMYKRQG